MKKNLLFLIVSLSSFTVGTQVFAENNELTTKTTANVEDGVFKVKAASGSINFGEIQPAANRRIERRAYYPKINSAEFKNNVNLNTETYYWDYGNPYDPNSEPTISPEPNIGTSLSTIEVFNSDLNITDWQVKLSRTPMKNKNNKEISGEKLFIGEMNDWGDLIRMAEKDNYQLANHVTVTGEKTLVASYSKDASYGTHLISPFGKQSENANDEPIENNIEIKNMFLGISADTVIPEKGEYSSDLIWIIEKGPAAESIQ
ncbi:hypothetical protein P7H62_07380 [Vagococcus carniphilus]|uniref:hypothetical protein n=1 Tax=Vagococcus carniphilus TaxID=218144 RepID=UPI0028918EEA|nr:hypothetical protein [Vagococcus carniphilus]MDT2829837.1 hypothetical protein [Vagococcus carniphilus]MDT2838271.1 hypothetical protein [Vagococcus carniphilus]MDT2854267.1 hypothetical protein [Vagococcus carniphilus]